MEDIQLVCFIDRGKTYTLLVEETSRKAQGHKSGTRKSRLGTAAFIFEEKGKHVSTLSINSNTPAAITGPNNTIRIYTKHGYKRNCILTQH
jgi:hypothetical protein